MKFLILGLSALACLSAAAEDPAAGCKSFFKSLTTEACNQIKDADCKSKCTSCCQKAQTDGGIYKCLEESGVTKNEKAKNYVDCFECTKLLPLINFDSIGNKVAECGGDQNPCPSLGKIKVAELIEKAKEAGGPKITDKQKKCLDEKLAENQAALKEMTAKCPKIDSPPTVKRNSATCILHVKSLGKNLFGLKPKEIDSIESCLTALVKG